MGNALTATVMELTEYYRRGYDRQDGTSVAPALVRSHRRAAPVPRRRLVVFLEWYATVRLLLIVLRLGGQTAFGLTGLAVLLAGRKRAAVRDEWRAHLAGEAGHELPPWRKVGAALGFLVAAVRYRIQDAADLAWIPADAILRSRPLSNLVVWFPTAGAAVILFHHGGIEEVFADAESIIAIGGVLYGLIRAGRWWRGVKPPDPKPVASASDQQESGPGTR